MKKRLLSNWGLKLLAFLFAFGLWFFVIWFDNPPGEQHFTNIPVQMLNTDILTDQGKVYEVLNKTGVVPEVIVKGPRKVLATMENSSISAVADFSLLSEEGTVPVRLSVDQAFARDGAEVEFASGEPQEVSLFVEDRKTRSVTIRVQIEGSVKEGYQLGRYEAEPNLITISGGESKINRVSYAQATVDVGGSDSDINTSATIRLYDKDGNLLDEGIQKNSSSTKLTIAVLGTKTVPIRYVVSGEPQEGYAHTGEVISSQDMIEVAGSEAVLADLDSIEVSGELLDITGRRSDLVTTFDIGSYLPAGVSVAENAENGGRNIEVRARIEKEVQKPFKVLSGNISVVNIPQGYTCTTADDHAVYDITVSGLADQVALIDESTLSGTIDVADWMREEELNELPVGVIQWLPVHFQLPEGVDEMATLSAYVVFSLAAEEAEQ